ncbi:LytTR family transcriptional regulator DNA-binding domain-containing protein [Pedobacter helvus]|uniref:LytTR family transcriptional regulator DNA-binding domain-containing protein n=1 Tax=Pedobacter helvus TaxID=2563444 RepID=A0ABW9JL09_9SPHI|nr:LytTR family transcriptional regulator DNA-binding domain-containing protein [Pedobacter ureilyticus]
MNLRLSSIKGFFCYQPNSKPIYPKWPFLPLAIGTALALLLYVETIYFPEDFYELPLYIAWLASSVMAALVIYIVYQVSIKLDDQYSWRYQLRTRLKHQAIKGVLVPTLVAFIGMSVYFYCASINILYTIWIRKYLWAILLLLLSFNSAFGFYWLANVPEVSHVAVQAVSTSNHSVIAEIHPVLTELPIAKESSFAQEDQLKIPDYAHVACIFSYQKHYHQIDFNGLANIWDHSIDDSVKLLPATDFVRVNRSFILNFNAIKGLEEESAKVVFLLLNELVACRIDKIRANNETDEQLGVAAETSSCKGFKVRLSYDRKSAFQEAYGQFKKATPKEV